MNFAETLSQALSQAESLTGSQTISKIKSKIVTKTEPKTRSKTGSKTGSKRRSKNRSKRRPFSVKSMQSTARELFSRGLSWIQARNEVRKSNPHLHVCATVALGEKRFVSVIECNGVRFLIGGGASTVSLLTQLPASQDTSGTLPDAVLSESAR